MKLQFKKFKDQVPEQDQRFYYRIKDWNAIYHSIYFSLSDKKNYVDTGKWADWIDAKELENVIAE